MLGLLPFAVIVLLDVLGAGAEEGPTVDVRLSRALESRLEGLVRRRETSSSKLRRRDAGITQVSLSTDGSSYYTLISAGNIDFRVALDTASSDFWLVSTACTTNQCKAVPSYPLTYQSPSFGVINSNSSLFNLSFADGTVTSGFLATESVHFENFTIPEQVFGVVDESNVTLKNEISGVLGLGFPRLSAFSSFAVNGLLPYRFS